MPRAQLHRIPHAALESPSLELEKFHDYDDFEAAKIETKKRGDWFGRVVPAVRAACTTYPRWHSDFEASARSAGAEVLAICATDWRLVIGWASNPGLETGITLHRLFGFPYLPGSAVRGVVHHFAELDLMEGENPLTPFRDALLTTLPSPSLIAGVERALLVRALFGSLHLRRPESSDLQETPLELLETWREQLSAPDEVPTGWEQFLAHVQTLCGAENLGGVVSFLDAVPEPKTLLAETPLQLDVLTSHYSKYYTDLDSRRPSVPPADTEGPNPVKFLAVRPGLKFEFRVRLRIPDPTDEPAKQTSRALGGRSADDIRGQLQTWLLRALTEFGIGAKTTAGYGFFAKPVGITLGEKARPDSDLQANAAEFLPPGLPMGVLAQRIDEAQLKAADQQAAIAQQLSRNYRKEIATWRKQIDKPAAQRRVQWLDKFMPVGGGGKQ